jgi:hypothetical protein
MIAWKDELPVSKRRHIIFLKYFLVDYISRWYLEHQGIEFAGSI